MAILTLHYNHLSEAEAERLAILIEEAGEVIQAATKVLRHGYESTDPTKARYTAESNRQALSREIRDLCHAIERMEVRHDVGPNLLFGGSAHFTEPGGIRPYLHHQEIQE